METQKIIEEKNKLKQLKNRCKFYIKKLFS